MRFFFFLFTIILFPLVFLEYHSYLIITWTFSLADNSAQHPLRLESPYSHLRPRQGNCVCRDNLCQHSVAVAGISSRRVGLVESVFDGHHYLDDGNEDGNPGKLVAGDAVCVGWSYETKLGSYWRL